MPLPRAGSPNIRNACSITLAKAGSELVKAAHRIGCELSNSNLDRAPARLRTQQNPRARRESVPSQFSLLINSAPAGVASRPALAPLHPPDRAPPTGRVPVQDCVCLIPVLTIRGVKGGEKWIWLVAAANWSVAVRSLCQSRAARDSSGQRTMTRGSSDCVQTSLSCLSGQYGMQRTDVERWGTSNVKSDLDFPEKCLRLLIFCIFCGPLGGMTGDRSGGIAWCDKNTHLDATNSTV